MTQATMTEKEGKDAARKARSEDMDKREKELNASRTGVGKRIFLAMTRGKGTQEIQFESFDADKPETLPTSLQYFIDTCKYDEAALVKRLIAGDYELAYTEASDPIKEFVNPAWDEDRQKGFRVVVRNYAANTGVSIEDAVALIKPGIEKAFAAAQAEKKTA